MWVWHLGVVFLGSWGVGGSVIVTVRLFPGNPCRLAVDESKMENEELVSKLRSKTDEVEKLRNHYTILQSSQPAGKEGGSSKELQRMAEEKEKVIFYKYYFYINAPPIESQLFL